MGYNRDMSTCKDCWFWRDEGNTPYWYEISEGWKNCIKASASEWEQAGEPRLDEGFALDHEGCSGAELVTGPDFGCLQFLAKTEPEPRLLKDRRERRRLAEEQRREELKKQDELRRRVKFVSNPVYGGAGLRQKAAGEGDAGWSMMRP